MRTLNRAIRGLSELAKSVAFRHTTFGAPEYPYPNIEPIELATLINEIERTKAITGNIVEIGVARGMTTRFLCEHIVDQGLESSLTLYAVDTFSSFRDEDMDYEVTARGKRRAELIGFRYNDYDAWKRNFSAFPFVSAIQADCGAVDYSRFAPIKLAFLDVDLYIPTKRALPGLYRAMSPGSIILVDDVRENHAYDGAYQAYMEFCQELSLTPLVIGRKCGIIRKQP